MELYSLGVVFFELMCGRPSFDVADPMDMARYHIATMTSPPNEIKAGIPVSISAIVMKLLAKKTVKPIPDYQGTPM